MRIANGKHTAEDRFYISSMPPDSLCNANIRKNKLHRTLNMTFQEDWWAKRRKMAAKDFSLITKFAFNILKKDKSKLSLKNKRLKTARNWRFLTQLIQI